MSDSPLTENELRDEKLKLEKELAAHQAELQRKFASVRVDTNAEKQSLTAPDTLLMSKFTIPEEYMPWFSQLELNNQKFSSELKKRLGDSELGQVQSTMTPNKFVLAQGSKTLVEAEWVFLGTYRMMHIEDTDESAEAGVAPGDYYSWGWPWVIIEEAPEALALRAEVDQISEIDERLKTGVALFRDGMIIRYIMAVLTEKMHFDHIYTSKSEATTSVFGFRKIVYGELAAISTDGKKSD